MKPLRAAASSARVLAYPEFSPDIQKLKRRDYMLTVDELYADRICNLESARGTQHRYFIHSMGFAQLPNRAGQEHHAAALA